MIMNALPLKNILNEWRKDAEYVDSQTNLLEQMELYFVQRTGICRFYPCNHKGEHIRPINTLEMRMYKDDNIIAYSVSDNDNFYTLTDDIQLAKTCFLDAKVKLKAIYDVKMEDCVC